MVGQCPHRLYLCRCTHVLPSFVRLSESAHLGCSPSFSRFTGVHVRKDLHSSSECILVAHNVMSFFLTRMGLVFWFLLQGSNQHPQANHNSAAQCSFGHALRRRTPWASARAFDFNLCPFHLEDFTGECCSLCPAALWLSGPVRPSGGILSLPPAQKTLQQVHQRLGSPRAPPLPPWCRAALPGQWGSSSLWLCG